MAILLLIINILCMVFILYKKHKDCLKTSIWKNILLGFAIFCTIGSVITIDIKEASLVYSVLAIILYAIYFMKSGIIIKTNSNSVGNTNLKNIVEISNNNTKNFNKISNTSQLHFIKNFNIENLSDSQLDAYNRKGDEQIKRINNIRYNLETKEDYEKAIEVYEDIILNEGMHFTSDFHLMRLAELYYKTEQYDKAWNYLNDLQFSYPLLIHKIRCFQVKILKKENRNVDALATLMCANLYDYSNQKSSSIDVERFKKEANILLKKIGLDKDESYFSYLIYLINCQLKYKTSLSNKEVTLRKNFQNFLHDINSNKNMTIELNKGKKEVKNMNKKAEQDKKQLNIKPGYYPDKLQAILNEQPPNTNNINKLNEFYQNHSKKLYEIHLANISNFVIEPNKYNTYPITSVEKSFLKYIDSQPITNPSIAQYWTYEYNLDFNKTINRFLDNDYIKIVNYKNPINMTVPELKEILKKANIKPSGNKDNLIKLVHENITIDMLEKLFDNQEKYFLLTDKGIELTSDIRPSITKDLEYEDTCYALIYNYEFEQANTLIYNFENNKNIKQCINTNIDISSNKKITTYENPINPVLDKKMAERFETYINSTDKTIPLPLQKYEKEMRVCIVMGQMMGVNLKKVELLFLRKNNTDIDKKIIGDTIRKLYSLL